MSADKAWTAASWAVGFAVFIGVTAASYVALDYALEWVWTTYFPELAYSDVKVAGYSTKFENPVPSSWSTLGQPLVSLAIGAVAGKLAGDKS